MILVSVLFLASCNTNSQQDIAHLWIKYGQYDDLNAFELLLLAVGVIKRILHSSAQHKHTAQSLRNTLLCGHTMNEVTNFNIIIAS